MEITPEEKELDPENYRRQILALKQFFSGRECTVLALDDKTSRPTTCSNTVPVMEW